jgi:hypothetical protein
LEEATAVLVLVAGAAAAEGGSRGVTSARASGFGSAESFVASFSSCCRYICAALDVYCKEKAARASLGLEIDVQPQRWYAQNCGNLRT